MPENKDHSEFDKLFKTLEDKAGTEGTKLEELIVANTKQYGKEIQQIMNHFIQDYQLFKHDKIDPEVYEEITEAKKRAVENFARSAPTDALNTVFRFLWEFIKWAGPIVKKVLENWLKGQMEKHIPGGYMPDKRI